MLILASASQSRKKLLENCQIKFLQISSNFDESSIKEKNIYKLALELSFHKANSLSENIHKISLPEEFNYGPVEILGCDSIFEFKGEAYGKPSNKEEAFIRWKKMSGEFGFLHTGHTLIIGNFDSTSKNFKIAEIIKKTVSSRVYFSKLEDWEIKSYVDTNEPLYCAGGFALEGIGGKYIDKIEGCFSNVMGLSLPWLRENLYR
ncbi:nucleoside triphosphate pyrophosphatase [Prochlorococcus marinus]|uniref:nucleoside triphosphate pyrophosphatase n=1 Tax=Prochlorococcus marinus TaxID=1219 RepID=UPI001ADAA8F8|nr:nucleoside triphosphate pyrophosphatase [Prochlorococcus marinus]MBO8221347.1 septum formation protein Maf [Prochlorococcus marinus CUG1417]MBW3074157.1 septum formation protein Maf [Prochlorococcus marinus str. MU1417]